MQLDIEKLSHEEEMLRVAESIKIKKWRDVVTHWTPLNRGVASFLASLPQEDRREGVKTFSKEAGDDYIRFVNGLLSLSNTALGLVARAIKDTEQQNKKLFSDSK